MESSSSHPIEAINLTKRFGNQTALDGISFYVEPGQVFGLLGRNGSGKSTTLRLLANFLEPSAGEVRLFGRPVATLRPRDRARLGYVSESMALPDWMSVTDLLHYLRPMYPTWDRALEAKLLQILSLPMSGRLGSFSRGMKMKAAFLAALCYRPSVLLLDEPFSGLDSQAREETVSALLELATEAEWAVVLSSHDMDEVERLVDHVGWIESGNLRLQESVSDLEGRCREISFHAEDLGQDPPWPSAWLSAKRRGRLITAIDSAVSDERQVHQDIISLWPQATAIEIRPVGMRHIYLGLLRSVNQESLV